MCVDSPEFLDLLNDSVRILMDRGNWWNTVQRITFCAWNNCLTFPRQVGTLLALDRCGNTIPPRNHWFSFSDTLATDYGYWNNLGGFGGYSGWPGYGFGSNYGLATAVDGNTTSVFNQIPCLQARYVRYYPTDIADVGKTITVFGIDGNGQIVRTTRTDGTVQEGEVITLAIPYAQSTTLFRRVDRVIKHITQRPVFGYQFDGGNQYNLSVYQPTETLPEYRYTRVVGGCCAQGNSGQACGCTPKQYSALVKQQFVECVTDDDLVQISNVDALAMTFQGIKAQDSYGPEEAEKFFMQATRQLNLELRNKMPNAQTPATVRYQGGAPLQRRLIGYLV